MTDLKDLQRSGLHRTGLSVEEFLTAFALYVAGQEPESDFLFLELKRGSPVVYSVHAALTPPPGKDLSHEYIIELLPQVVARWAAQMAADEGQDLSDEQMELLLGETEGERHDH